MKKPEHHNSVQREADVCRVKAEDERFAPPAAGTIDEDFFRQVNIEFLVHELKSPVSIIESGARLLLDKQGNSPLTAQQARTLERILRNALKTRHMLAELLEMGRARNACFECRPFNPLTVLLEILIQTVESSLPELYGRMGDLGNDSARLAFLAQNGIRLEASEAVRSMTIEQDEIKFSQIVGNLIKNGLHHRRRHLLIHATRRKEMLYVSIRDDGPGISPAHHEAIFERYKQVTPCETVARSGHGLGLAMARILARAMGGDIQVESELGQGALFHLNIPIIFPPSPEKSDAKRAVP